MKKFAVVLAGCGVFDGAEIQESVLTMLAIKKNGAEYEIFAPDIFQHDVVNHISGEEMHEKRNVMIEAARIARGKIRPLSDFKSGDFDVLIFPGGFGVAKNLITYAFEGIDSKVNPDVEKVVTDMLQHHKPIGAVCISPVLIAKIVGDGVELTIGNDTGTVADIEKMGAKHKITDHGQIVIDQSHKIVTSPCYMLDANIEQIWEGVEKTVKALLELI